MSGRPCIRRLRVTVGMVVRQVGAGHSIDEILAYYPYLAPAQRKRTQCAS
ncbi:DUF433 domain-containing protein [Reyranella sp.]